MWKRWIIKLAWNYLEEIFLRWKASQSEKTKKTIEVLMANMQQYCMTRNSTTHTLICDLLSNWRD